MVPSSASPLAEHQHVGNAVQTGIADFGAYFVRRFIHVTRTPLAAKAVRCAAATSVTLSEMGSTRTCSGKARWGICLQSVQSEAP